MNCRRHVGCSFCEHNGIARPIDDLGLVFYMWSFTAKIIQIQGFMGFWRCHDCDVDPQPCRAGFLAQDNKNITLMPQSVEVHGWCSFDISTHHWPWWELGYGVRRLYAALWNSPFCGSSMVQKPSGCRETMIARWWHSKCFSDTFCQGWSINASIEGCMCSTLA